MEENPAYIIPTISFILDTTYSLRCQRPSSTGRAIVSGLVQKEGKLGGMDSHGLFERASRGDAGFRHWLFAIARRKIADRYAYWSAAKRDIQLETRSRILRPLLKGCAVRRPDQGRGGSKDSA